MSDDARFYLEGFVNNQNFTFWSSENPQVFARQACCTQFLSEGVLCAVGELEPSGQIFLRQ